MDTVNLNQDGFPSDSDKRYGGIGIKRQAKTMAEAKTAEITPINIRLLDKKLFLRPSMKPRRYQEELYLKALEQNLIIYLGTGLGKTFITVLVLNSPLFDEQIRLGRKVVFLAPTQDLVKQQAEYVVGKVPYNVRVYCGRTAHLGLHIDFWKEDQWNAELAKVDILFMTPQIFSSAISTGHLVWHKFSLVIFDEVHHAATSKKEKNGRKSGTPYSQALNHFKIFSALPSNRDNPPRFIGLTASLINNMPTSVECIRNGINDLERKLNAKCVTDLTAIETKPQMVIYAYTKPSLDRNNDVLMDIFYLSSACLEEALATSKVKKISALGPKTDEEKEIVSYLNRLKLASSGFSIKPGSFHKVLRQLAAIRANSGLWTLANICYNLHIAVEKHSKSIVLTDEIRPMYTHFAAFLKKIFLSIESFLGPKPTGYLLDYSQPKLHALLEILRYEHSRALSGDCEKETFSCIVFVQSRVEVIAISGWLKNVSDSVPGYDFMKVNHAIGLAATLASKWSCITKRKSAEQGAMLDDFRRGRLNIIVTTSVLEEGIDLPVCSTVIRYDPALTFRAHVQSRGRARQSASSYIAMCENDKQEETKLNLNKFNDFEERVKEFLKNDSPRTRPVTNDGSNLSRRQDADENDDFFVDVERSIRIDASMARIILHMYCSRLARRCPYSAGLTYEREETDEKLFRTKLFFPPGCPIKDGVSGKDRRSVDLADNSAVVSAYRALYKAGELDEHGVPIRATEEHTDAILEKYNLKPDFKPLDQSLEGKVKKIGEREVNIFEWKLCRLNMSIARDFTRREYKLYRINFKAAADDKVRQETRPFFEQQTLGMIIDDAHSHTSWPSKLHSHYGEFLVEYELIDTKVKIDDFRDHNLFSNYTYRYMKNFLIAKRFNRDAFKENCLYYLVPLDKDNQIIDSKLRDAFFTQNCELKPNDLVKKNVQYSSYGENLRTYIVKAVHNNMNPNSEIPSMNGETFYSRAASQYGDDVVRNFNQPIIEVVPIAQEIARSSQGSKVTPEYQTSSMFFIRQFLDFFTCDIPTAFQIYNLPEIIYKIYLNALTADLDDRYLRATLDYRRNPTMRVVRELSEYDRNLMRESDSEEDDEGGSEANDQNDAECVETLAPVDGDYYDEEEEGEEYEADGDADYLSSGAEEEYDDNDDDGSDDYSHEPKSANQYRDFLCRQAFNLTSRDKEMEKWDMDEYNVPDLRTLSYTHMSCNASPKYVNTSPRFDNAFGNLRAHALGHVLQIREILSQFRAGILDKSDYRGEEHIYKRRESIVDLGIEPPVKFDRVSKPFRESPRELHFVEALTQRRAGESHNLEALENIGDSYLKYCVSVVLFKTIERNEGQLTYARSRLVGNRHFNHLAKKNKLGCYVIGRKFDMSVLASALGAEKACENVMRPKDLADVIESIIGACLIYRGEYDAIMAMKWLGLNIFRDDTFAELHENAVAFEKPELALTEDDDKTRQHLRQCQDRVKKFEDIIKYKFVDRTYLVQAFTHASAPQRVTDTYERLEFLGDAILDFLVTMTLYNAGYTTDPGQITSSRSAIVNNCTFAKLAIKYKFDIYLQHLNQELFDELSQVDECAKSDNELSFLDDFKFDKITKTLGDLFESVAGAIYCDSGCSLDTVYRIYYPMMKETIDSEISNPTKNIIVQLYELFTGPDRIKFEFFQTQTSSNDDTARTCAKLTIFGLEPFYGEGTNKHQAKMRAVAEAMSRLPSQAEKDRLDLEYSRIVARKAGPNDGRRGARGGGRSRGGRGRGSRGQRGGGGGHANFSRREQQPYPHRGGYSNSGRGQHSGRYRR